MLAIIRCIVAIGLNCSVISRVRALGGARQALAFTAIILVVCVNTFSQNESLARRADWGLKIDPPQRNSLPTIREIGPNSVAQGAGLRVGDKILGINGIRVNGPSKFGVAYRAVRGGERINLQVVRDGRLRRFQFSARSLRLETFQEVDTEYSSVRSSRGYRLRTIVTRPLGVTQPLPAILFLPWLSCDPVEPLDKAQRGWSRILRTLILDSGFLIMRVEKPGVGDSEGPDCSRTDLNDDLEAYRAAFNSLKRNPLVKHDQIFIFGASMGAALAPLVAGGYPVRGFLLSGGFVKTWYEHMIELERRRLALSGALPGEVNIYMRGYSEFYSLYLNRGLTPGEIISRHSKLARLWSDEPTHQYGRSARFFQRLQQLNLEQEWTRVRSPVLIIHGEYDWIMSRDDQDIILRIVNGGHPGFARLVVFPHADHDLDVFEDQKKAFDDEGGRVDPQVAELMIAWLKQTLSNNA